MLRYLLVPSLVAVAVSSTAHAQQRKREDLLDALTRHIQVCAELNDGPSRLACYDKLQTQVGDVQPMGQQAPAPTPLRPGGPVVQAQGQQSLQPGNPTPLAPPPLQVPGGGNATLGSGQPGTLAQPSDPDRAFDPNASGTYRPPEGAMPKPQPAVRRTGPRPIPNFPNPMPLVSLAASNLTYGEARYWQVTIVITSNTPRALDTQIRCSFINAGRPVAEAYFGPTTIAPGEQITTDLIGPATTTYVDSTTCNVLSP